jgi:hypothetical protein
MSEQFGMKLKVGPAIEGYIFALVSDTQVVFLTTDGQIVVADRPKIDWSEAIAAWNRRTPAKARQEGGV